MFSYLRDRKFWHATAVLVGTMVGVGIFGIPFVFAKAGFLVGLAWLAGLAVVTAVYDLLFAEVTLRTQGSHQLAGYAGIYGGPWARRVTFFAFLLSGYGTLLAYMIIVGDFLHRILSQYIAVNPDWYGIVFALAWSLLVFARLRTVAVVDLVLMGLFGLTVAVIFIFGLRHIEWANFQGITREYWFLPYGVILFALAGANTVPIQRQLLAGRERLLRPAIIAAVLLVTALYLVFAFTVVGVSGDVTSPNAIDGLAGLVGDGVILLAALFGILTISTSFVMMSTALYELFHLDYKVRPVSAWLLVIVPPLVFFWSGLRNFIDVIGLVGSVAVGLLSVIVLFAWLKARKVRLRTPEFTVPVPALAVWLLIVLFAAGIVYALVVR